MRKLGTLLKTFGEDESGVAMVEYTILLGIITVAVIVSIIFVGEWVSDQWADLVAALTPAP